MYKKKNIYIYKKYEALSIIYFGLYFIHVPM